MIVNASCLYRRHPGRPRFGLHWRESNDLLCHAAFCGPYGELWATLKNVFFGSDMLITVTSLNYTHFTLQNQKYNAN